ncbi:MAG: carbohydrate kinase family protein [Candidatus Babeliales bacterium]
MKKVLTIGSATQDIFIHYKNTPTTKIPEDLCSYILVAEGCKIEVDDIHYTVGGGATNSATSFKKLGFDVASFFQIGTDHEGTFITNELKKHAINLELICSTNAHKTGRSFILPSPSGNQPILAYRGANAYIEQKNLPLSKLNLFDFLYITSLSGISAESLLPLAKKAHELNIFVATNPGKSQLADGIATLKKALPYISLFSCNTLEACQLMHSLKPSLKNNFPGSNDMPTLLQKPLSYKEITFDLAAYFHTIHKMGPSIVVVTNGAEGVYVSDAKTIYFQPTTSAKVVSTVGAGDAFSSTFVGCIQQGLSLQKALKYGVANAASVIGALGPQQGLLSLAELEKKAHALPNAEEFKL